MGAPSWDKLVQYLSTIGSAVAGNAQPIPAQAAQAPAAPAPSASPTPIAPAQPAAPTSGGGLTGFLSNPAVQGGLAAYLGAIGSPRSGGFGGAISRGGLAGLSQFGAAQTAQQNAQLQPGKLALQTAQVGQATAGAARSQAQAAQLAGIKDHNAQVATTLRLAKPGMTPEQAQRADIYASSIENDLSKAYDPKDVLNQIYSQPLKDKQTVASTKLYEANATKVPSEIAASTAAADASGASAGLHRAETAAIPEKLKIEHEKAGKTSTPKPADPALTATHISKVRADAGKEFDGKHPFASKLSTEAYNVEKDKYIQERVDALGLGGSSKAGGALPPLPPGAKEYAKGPDGSIGYHDAAGAFHPF